eukprot:CAMPEP_0114577706 /NCGR_PEP_ID=MMETSP0125-20121206/2343_1 /TAXON_ID=485358 ORGANISM="Aristerostoma sp., Strain ATCC 50986" /NCGR_SAMPLE_ID=MMETSP0125 /ASSEMBLY_ACC=CAM_ASM_000245 /LENGTH=58 /DNA_ID=CAMNT_0001767239 /DNA_START=10 /DNA_END=186 /DNA_ORIENTATION=-
MEDNNSDEIIQDQNELSPEHSDEEDYEDYDDVEEEQIDPQIDIPEEFMGQHGNENHLQ